MYDGELKLCCTFYLVPPNWAHFFVPSLLEKLTHISFPQAFISSFLSFLFIYFCFLGPYLQHMEVPGLGVELEL